MNSNKARLIGLNHAAIEVADVAEALRFYGAVFEFQLRGSHRNDNGEIEMAFIDMGDQFLALSGGRTQTTDGGRHIGLVVDDRRGVIQRAEAAGAKVLEREFNFLDPWGNHIEIVAYRDVQFAKTDEILEAMGVSLDKTDAALAEIAAKRE